MKTGVKMMRTTLAGIPLAAVTAVEFSNARSAIIIFFRQFERRKMDKKSAKMSELKDEIERLKNELEKAKRERDKAVSALDYLHSQGRISSPGRHF